MFSPYHDCWCSSTINRLKDGMLLSTHFEQHSINSLPTEKLADKFFFPKTYYELSLWAPAVKSFFGECHRTLLVISQWLGTVKQQVIIVLTNADHALCRHTASLGHNVLKLDNFINA